MNYTVYKNSMNVLSIIKLILIQLFKYLFKSPMKLSLKHVLIRILYYWVVPFIFNSNISIYINYQIYHLGSLNFFKFNDILYTVLVFLLIQWYLRDYRNGPLSFVNSFTSINE